MMTGKDLQELDAISEKIKRHIIKTSWLGRAGHLTSALSMLDITVALYFGNILRYRPEMPEWEDRDRFILAKAHGAIGLYNVLCEAGYIQREELNTFCKPGTIYGGETSIKVSGIENTGGSLGHGLSFAAGKALRAKMDKKDYLTYVLTGDGECQEGSIWEAAMSISKFHLNNLVWIIDHNGLQLRDAVDEVMSLSPLKAKLESFGLETVEVDGHDFTDLLEALSIDRNHLPEKPRAVIANTVKGKGIPYLENKRDWHGRTPKDPDFTIIIEQAGMSKEEFLEL